MKQTKILLALMMLAVFASCNDEFVDNTNSRHISITAELPDDNLTRASLSQKEGSLDFLTQWDEGDVVNLHIEQDGRFYEVKYTRPNALPGEVSFNQIPIKNISEEKRKAIIKTTHVIDERKYVQLSPEDKQLFADARTITPGKTKFKISIPEEV